MKTECFSFIKDLLKYLPEERVNKIEETLKKLSNEDAKTYTSEFLKKEQEKLQKSLRDKVLNVEKLNLIAEKVDAKMKTIISKDFFSGQENKADFNKALEQVFYNNNGEDLFYKRLVNVNQKVSPLLLDLEAVDKDLTNKMFSRTNLQKWRKVNPITTKTEKDLNTFLKNTSDDVRRELFYLNTADKEALMNPVKNSEVFDKEAEEHFAKLFKAIGGAEKTQVKQKAQFKRTENEKAVKYAETVKKHFDKMLEYLGIEKLDGYAGTQGHKLVKDTPKAKWVADVIDKYGLDIGKMFEGEEIEGSKIYKNGRFEFVRIKENGVERIIVREDLENMLYYIKEEIDNGAINENIFSGKGVSRRFIHFQDVEAQIKYNDDYNGGENILLQMKNKMKFLAEQQSMYDNLGTEPERLLNSLVNDYRVKNKEKDLKIDFDIKNGQIVPKKTLNVNAGHFIKGYLENSAEDTSLGKYMKGFRAVKGTLTLLPKLAITYISDTSSILFWNKLQGQTTKGGTFLDLANKFGLTLKGILHAPVSATSIGQNTRANLEKEIMKLGLTTKAITEDIGRFLSETTTGIDAIDGLTNISFSSTDYINNLQIKLGHRLLTENFLEDFGSEFSNLSKTRQFVYNKYNVKPEEFELAKKYMVKEIEGKKEFFTDLVSEIPDEEISKIARGDIFNKYANKTERTIDLARKDLKNKFDVWYQKSIDELNSEDRIGAKMFLQRNTKSGTIEGEVARSFSELQTWSWQFYDKMLKSIIKHPEFTRKEKLGSVAVFGAIGMLSAYMSRSASSLASGRMPESLVNEDGTINVQTILSSAEYSGMFTPIGEMSLKLAGKSGRSQVFRENQFYQNILQTFLGPSLGGAIGNIGKTLANKDKFLEKMLTKDGIVEFITNNIPKINLLQPIITSMINLNFLLSDERVAEITNNASKNNRDYLIPTK
jgi:hypothetical protein